MSRCRLTVDLIGWLATVVLRRWAMSCGIEPTHMMRKAVYACALVGVGSAVLANLIDTEQYGLMPALYARRIACGVSMSLFVASMLSSILIVQSLGVVTNRMGFRMLPVSGRVLGLGLGLPVLLMFLAVCALFAPALVVFLKTTFLPAVHAATLVVASTLVGGSMGALAVSVIAQALSHARRTTALSIPLAVGLWVCVSAIGLWRFPIVAVKPASALSPDLWLVWPLLAQAVLSGTITSFMTVGVLVLASTIVALLALDPTMLSAHERTAVAAPVVSWKAGALPLSRLELVRLVRTRHVLQSIGVSAVVFVAAVAWMVAGPAKISGGQALLTVGMCFVCAQTGLLARGLSARSQPYPLRLGFTPSHWAYAVVVAGAIPGILLSLPLLCTLMLKRPLSELALVVGFQVFLYSWAAVVGFVLHLDKENTSGMVTGGIVFMVGGLGALGMATIPHGFYRGKTAIGITLAIAGVFLALLVGALETARWRSSVNTVRGEQQ